MPYTVKEVRGKVDEHIDSLIGVMDYYAKNKGGHGINAGLFTYVVYRLLGWWNGKFWMRALGTGCLIMAILEMYRRKHVKYEDEKIEENGDVEVP